MTTKKEELRLDENHRYWLGSREIPSVSAVLRSNGLIDTTYMTDYGRDRGSFVHEATALWDRGELDEAVLDPALKPYLEGWKLFRTEIDFEHTHIEQPMAAVLRGFAGTPDRIGFMNKRRVILEIKAGKELPWHKLQCGAYKHLAEVNGVRIDDRYAIYLPGDGLYRLRKHDDPGNEQEFLALLAAFHVKINYGGKNGI